MKKEERIKEMKKIKESISKMGLNEFLDEEIREELNNLELLIRNIFQLFKSSKKPLRI